MLVRMPISLHEDLVELAWKHGAIGHTEERALGALAAAGDPQEGLGAALVAQRLVHSERSRGRPVSWPPPSTLSALRRRSSCSARSICSGSKQSSTSTSALLSCTCT